MSADPRKAFILIGPNAHPNNPVPYAPNDPTDVRAIAGLLLDGDNCTAEFLAELAAVEPGGVRRFVDGSLQPEK